MKQILRREYIEAFKRNMRGTLNNISINNNYDIVCLFVTNIITNGSYILFNDSARNTISLAFNLIISANNNESLLGIFVRKPSPVDKST